MKRVALSFVLMMAANSALAGGTLSGTIGVRLEVLPASGCISNRCALDPRQTLEDMQQGKAAKDFKTTRKDNLLTVEF